MWSSEARRQRRRWTLALVTTTALLPAAAGGVPGGWRGAGVVAQLARRWGRRPPRKCRRERTFSATSILSRPFSLPPTVQMHRIPKIPEMPQMSRMPQMPRMPLISDSTVGDR
jgi:hypothetical protein